MAGFKEYQMMFQLNASMGGSFQSAFSAGSSSVSQLQDKINALNKTQGDISSYQKQQSAIDKTKAKIELYQGQLQNLQNATASTSKEEAELANAILAKEKQLTDSNDKLAQQNAALSETGAALRAAGVDTNNLASESERLKAEAQEVAQAQKQEAEAAQQAGKGLQEAMQGARAAIEAAGVITALKAVYSGLSDCSGAAAEFETAMAGVKRTVGGSDAFIKDLGSTFKQLSTEIPISATELANIATTAGQLGIAQENVQQFSTVMAQLATTTDLSADSAATMLAQFANITGTTDYERLGSTVAALGDSTATTASKVVEMSQGMAAAANIAGMSERDILAISAAVGSLGIEAAAGSTSMSQLITKLYKATETGDQLEDIAAVAGMTGAQFKQAWATDAVGALDSFVQGLNNVEQNGRSAVVVLDDLGINNVRQTKAILGLASAGDLLSNTISQANSAWDENSALAQKAGIMYNTTEAKLQMMGNAANNVKIAVGDALNPALGAVSGAITGLLEPIAEWISANPAVVQGITAAVGAIGLATAGITAYTAVTKLAAAASKLFTASLPIGWILGIAGAIGVAVGVISALSGAGREAAKSFSEMDQEYDSLISQMQEQNQILDLVDQYKDLSAENENLQTIMKKGFKTTVTVEKSDTKLSAEDFIGSTTVKLNPAVAKELASTDFLKDSKIKLTPEQASYLASKDFITGGLTVELTPEQAETLTSSSFLRSTKVKLTPEQQKYLKSDDFINGKKVVELTPEQAKKLEAAGFLNGTTVQLTGEQAKTLAAEGFLDNTEVELTAKAKERLKVSDFWANEIVTITGEAGNTLTAADFGISETTLTYIATMDGTSYQDVQNKAFALQQEVASVGSQLNTAKTVLAKSTELAEALSSKISGTKNRKEKTALQSDLEALNESIAAQQENVDQLQLKYDTLTSEYGTVSTAADELAGKEAELLAIKQQLAGVTGDVADASRDQASAYTSEAEAAEREAQAQLAMLRNSVYGSINEQAKTYKNTMNDAAEATDRYNKFTAQQAVANKMSGKSADEIEASYRSMLATLDQMEQAEGWTPDNEAYKQAVAEAEAFMSLITGMDYSGIQADADRLGDGTIEWAESFDYLAGNAQNWNTILEDLNANVADYSGQIDSADQTQSAFIDNLVAGITEGGMDITEIEARVRDALEGEADAEETVAAIMKDVQAGVDAVTAAKEAQVAATEELTETDKRSVDEIVEELKTLQKEYDEAYKSAYSSMSGQFKLFENASDKIKQMHQGYKGGTKGMTSGIESQTQYINDYTTNFELASQKLAKAGVDAQTAQTILAGLSDGSAESGAALESIAKGSTDDAKALGEAYKSMEEAKTKYASTVAEMQTDFSSKMTELANELATTVAGMDKSSEAASAAKSTLSAYVNAADGYVGLAAAKYGRVAAAAVAALKKTFGGLGIPGFASGTKNAPKGMAIVGEDGPELVYFNGGETVVPADQTAQMAKNNAMEAEGVMPGSNSNITNGGSSYNVNFSPQYHVESGVNAEELQSVLESQSGNLREQLEDMLREITEDNNRRDLR